jgi:deuterolysin
LPFDEEAFQVIPAGQAVEVSFDAAELHDLANSGAYDFVANGVLSYAAADSTEIAGVVPYVSNTVTANVDGAEAAKSRAAFMNKRTVSFLPSLPSLSMFRWLLTCAQIK